MCLCLHFYIARRLDSFYHCSDGTDVTDGEHNRIIDSKKIRMFLTPPTISYDEYRNDKITN